MLTLLKQFFPGALRSEAVDTASPPRMSLDERKAYRREMLYQSIRESMLGLEALSSMYKFKVVSVDERHHRFIVMIAVTDMFRARRAGQDIGFTEIEAFIKQRTFERYGVVLDGMYWRVDPDCASYTRARRAGDTAQTAIKPQSPRQMRTGQRLARQPYEPVTEQEREQFVHALRQGQRPAPLRVGAQVYESDLAPLDATAEVGGTQYGQL